MLACWTIFVEGEYSVWEGKIVLLTLCASCVCGLSQAEPRAQLSLASRSASQNLKIKPRDLILYSAKVRPELCRHAVPCRAVPRHSVLCCAVHAVLLICAVPCGGTVCAALGLFHHLNRPWLLTSDTLSVVLLHTYFTTP